jgi:hypothetical protein
LAESRPAVGQHLADQPEASGGPLNGPQ